MKKILCISLIVAVVVLAGCSTPPPPPARVPSMEYAQKAKQQYARSNPEYREKLIREEGFTSPASHLVAQPASSTDPRARLQFVQAANQDAAPVTEPEPVLQIPDGNPEIVSNLDAHGKIQPDSSNGQYRVYESTQPETRDYNGPLSLGDPGLSASLWRESRGASALFRDVRAWQPMDLITIIVSENSDAKKEADTNVKQESTFNAAISNLLGLESSVTDSNPQVDLNNLVNATSSSEFKGEGDTSRKGTLKASLSAMVVEVLPSGILRIEGEKIISVNSEDEVFVISGLVRPEDINSNNEVGSAKVANMRIDYYGKGSVGDAQHAGWLGRTLRRLWPF